MQVEGGSDKTFAIEGVVVGIVENSTDGACNDASGAQVVGEVIVDGVCRVAASDAFVVDENIFVEGSVCGHTIGVGLVERVGADAVPIYSGDGVAAV